MLARRVSRINLQEVRFFAVDDLDAHGAARIAAVKERGPIRYADRGVFDGLIDQHFLAVSKKGAEREKVAAIGEDADCVENRGLADAVFADDQGDSPQFRNLEPVNGAEILDGEVGKVKGFGHAIASAGFYSAASVPNDDGAAAYGGRLVDSRVREGGDRG